MRPAVNPGHQGSRVGRTSYAAERGARRAIPGYEKVADFARCQRRPARIRGKTQTAMARRVRFCPAFERKNAGTFLLEIADSTGAVCPWPTSCTCVADRSLTFAARI